MLHREIEDIYPLSPMQQGMLFHSLLAPDSGVYSEVTSCVLEGNLHPDAFARAWEETVNRHPILRTSFVWEDVEKPLQIVHRRVAMRLTREDWRALSKDEQSGREEEFLERERTQGFELTKPPLMRIALIQTGMEEYRFVWSHHHILLDGWSLPLLLKEVLERYGGLVSGQEVDLGPVHPYKDFIQWLRLKRQSGGEEFWREELRGFETATKLPLAHSAVAPSSDDHYRVARRQLSERTTAALQELARQHHLTLNTIVQGAWGLLLGLFSGEDDVVFGTTVSGRPAELPFAEHMIGLFINTVPVRVSIDRTMCSIDWLAKLQLHQTETRQYEHMPLVDIQRLAPIPHDAPLFETLLVFENYPVEESVPHRLTALQIKDVRNSSRTNYPLTLALSPGTQLGVEIAFEANRIVADSVEHIISGLFQLLKQISEHPDMHVSGFSLLNNDERKNIIEQWSLPPRSLFPAKSIHELIAYQARQTPRGEALICGGEHLSYEELLSRSNRLANYLQSLGVRRESIVGVCLDRSSRLIVSLLGVLTSGAAYLPLDASLPPERIHYMLDDSHASLLITSREIASDLQARVRTLCVDELQNAIERESDEAPLTTPFLDSLAYIIYTSGSTGVPKGVAVTHRGLANHARWATKKFGIGTSDQILQFLPVNFDAAAEEIFPALIAGATLVLQPNPSRVSGGELIQVCSEHHISILHLPVAFWHSCVDEFATTGVFLPDTLRTLIVGGEPPLPDKLRQWRSFAHHSTQFFNVYGPTETTIAVASEEVLPSDTGQLSIPIGTPIDNAQILLLDKCLNVVPAGVPAELFIGGISLARGYIGRADLTAEKFIPNPFSAEFGGRMYRTGDIGRYLPDGRIEFLGRIDDQVKLRGFRIELGEIEVYLERNPLVTDAAVLAVRDEIGEKRLVGFIVPKNGDIPNVDTASLQQNLRLHLPEYMIPGVFVVLDKMPLTPSGKVDRKALAGIEIGSDHTREEPLAAPRTPTEELLAGIWSNILGVPKVSIEDNFFALGGHSLRATQLVSRLRDAFSVELPLAAVFETPVLKDLAKRLDSARQTGVQQTLQPIERTSRDGNLPLSFAQQRLWFLDQLQPGGTFYNIPMGLRLTGRLDIDALQKSLQHVVDRHEILRTRFRTREGSPIQEIQEHVSMHLPLTGILHLNESERKKELERLTNEEVARPFNLEEGPLIRAQMVRMKDDEHILLITLHHIITDGWSMGILVEEIATAYVDQIEGRESTHEAMPIQYADYATWQRNWLQGEQLDQQLAYWKEQLRDAPPALELPTDRPRGATASFNGATEYLELSPDLSERIESLSKKESATPFMTLLAAFETLLHRYTGQTEIVVGTPIAGRRQSSVERLIGFFVNNLVLRTSFTEADSFKKLVHRVRTMTLNAYAHQDVPFEKLVEEFHPARNMGRAPLFQVMFVFQNVPISSIELPELKIENMQVSNSTANFELSLVIHNTPDGYVAEMEYNTDLFDAATIRRMLEHYKSLIKAIVADPTQRVSSVEFLEHQETQQQLVTWNNTSMRYPAHLCTHQIFELLAESHAGTEAVAFLAELGHESPILNLSYADLNRKANQLARYLLAFGFGREHLAGICMERSVDVVIGMLAAMKAGGGFVPLDPAYPRERLAYMLKDSGISILLTHEKLVDRLPIADTQKVVCVDRDRQAISQQADTNLNADLAPGNLAYVIYTSGSTGKPKGTMLSHGGLCNLAAAQKRAFDVEAGTRILQFSSLSFDASVWETVMALLNGGTLCLARQELITDVSVLDSVLRSLRVNIVTLPSSVLMVMRNEALPDLRTIIAAGEKCTNEIVERWSSGRRFFNAYGPTETTVCATMHECKEAAPFGPPIGRPLPNFDVYVLDGQLKPVPVGVLGELHVGGIGLARGYLHRPEITAEKFVPHPFSQKNGARLYKTGDLCRYHPDGTIEFVGRIDQQVKVRGFRIELGEIESVVTEFAGVRNVAVVARDAARGEKSLVAYVVVEPTDSSANHQDRINELKNFLRTRMPEYMVPSLIIELQEMPLTRSGKIDRRALPAPDRALIDAEREYVSPRNETEETLCSIAASLLDLGRVGIDDNFFDLGGHSLLATQFVSRLREEFAVDLPLRVIFEKPTIAGIGEEIELLRQSDSRASVQKIQRVSRDTVRVKRSSLESKTTESAP